MKRFDFFARRADRKFAAEICNNLARLVYEHSARVIPNDEADYRQARSFDHVIATLATPDLNLRFTRVRGEFGIDISIPGSPRKWEALDSALAWLDRQQGQPSNLPNWQYGYDGSGLPWSDIDQFLASNWERLKTAASPRP